MYRFRQYTGGVTRKSIEAFKHLDKIGSLLEIRGYRVMSVFKTFHANMEYVLVKGTKGSCRFSGLCWSYLGEGPRGLEQLLIHLGFERELAREISQAKRFHTPGIDWRITMPFKFEQRVSEEQPINKKVA